MEPRPDGSGLYSVFGIWFVSDAKFCHSRHVIVVRWFSFSTGWPTTFEQIFIWRVALDFSADLRRLALILVSKSFQRGMDDSLFQIQCSVAILARRLSHSIQRAALNHFIPAWLAALVGYPLPAADGHILRSSSHWSHAIQAQPRSHVFNFCYFFFVFVFY